MARRHLALFAVMLALGCGPVVEGSAVDSGDTESSADGACNLGALDCACTPGGACDPGLVCEHGICATEGAESGDEGSGEDCGTEGCACTPGSCDSGFMCSAGVCVALCGNGALDAGEQCDDADGIDGNGCDNDCTRTEILQIDAGAEHTCALIEGGRLRCWGGGSYGKLGYGNTENIGDNETPASAGDLVLPLAIESIALGGFHSCGRFVDGQVRCWGQNDFGQLGYGDTESVGDDETLAELAAVELGGTPLAVSVDEYHACARLEGAKLRCWGVGFNGRLGLGGAGGLGNYVGDDELPSAAPLVFVGATPTAAVAGRRHSCALTSDGQARCWGAASRGQLGYGGTDQIGDNEPPSDAGDIDLYPPTVAGTVSQLALGGEHSCALFSSGEVVCWGRNNRGQLGQGHGEDWGDGEGEHPAGLEPIALGGPAVAIAAGDRHNCALLGTGDVRCWGANNYGQLGLGMAGNVGDDELPTAVATVELGDHAIMITAGQEHSCALLEGYELLCWGRNSDGRLGYANTQTIGDDESPTAAGAVDLL
ncbi:hypothetical protein G6O69_12370 [Pseudenhygromyxa sp. WMMC2535]|uniref:hypothetical protein n=1 Tax=Pseudenhygromyxa sp. WMMC2535 TaxID=2712867 RepID=UPI0015583120|nr:hypothetical protein [Pseudenhygromyxa sp. WMMC2535]NVB38627.1 hypothetical protein [Pseudenhygromyxa sp. WMMC2535]